MLDTSVLKDRYETMMDTWLAAYSEILLGGHSVCDICHQYPRDGKFYPASGGGETELLVCRDCLEGYLTSVWRES